MLSCCAFAQANLNIFVSRSWQFYRSKHQTFTHEQRQLGSDCARACNMINGKKMLIMFVCAGLTLTPRAQVYLCLCCYHKFMRDKERILIFSTYDEFKHPLIFGVCALLLILLRIKQTKNAFIFIPLRILLRIFYKIIIIIYANMHVTIT